MIWLFIFSSFLMTLDPWLSTRLVHDLYFKSMEGHCVHDKLLRKSSVTYFHLHQKSIGLLIFDIYVWVISFGVWSLQIWPVIRTWYHIIVEAHFLFPIKIWSWCYCVWVLLFGSLAFDNLWANGTVVLHLQWFFQLGMLLILFKRFLFSQDTIFSYKAQDRVFLPNIQLFLT